MNITLLPDEVFCINSKKDDATLDEIQINLKYEEGYNRIVTEQGSLKLPSLKSLFSQTNYILKPKFQRRPNWDNEKKSKLIESFIINVPIPPVFLYERDFDSYEVMDGLQRISSIISFYNDEFELDGLEEWSELNGFKYSQLPKKIKEGIDRRQLATITLLKESAKSDLKAEEMKKMVFERLNTGGVKLEPQEIRNALYDGPFNVLCIDLSSNEDFRLLWDMTKTDVQLEIQQEDFETVEDSILFANDSLYKRMYDIELVLRFFAMRHIEQMPGSISTFLDNALINGNKYNENVRNNLSDIFKETMSMCNHLFSEKAFCQFKKIRKTFQWTKPQKAVYDPLCLVISQNLDRLRNITYNVEKNQGLLSDMYKENQSAFNAKNQSKSDIKRRALLFEGVITKIIEGNVNE